VQVIATLPDATRLVASYNRTVRTGPGRVTVAIDDMAPKLEKAKELLAAKKKADAKALLQDLIKRNPKSPRVEEARKLLTQTL
jgi:TolA-binding protein